MPGVSIMPGVYDEELKLSFKKKAALFGAALSFQKNHN
jgi:hypothetical protein